MCYRVEQKVTKAGIEEQFQVKMKGDVSYKAEQFAFDNPQIPIVLDTTPEQAGLSSWGLIPSWYANPDQIRQKTNNARYDELLEKKSYKSYKDQRCLIIVSGFYEYQHLIGGDKQLYLIKAADNKPFAIGGIWADWTDPKTGLQINTFSMLTQDARGIMREIHNSGLRQPLLLTKEIERDWLMSEYDPLEKVPDFELIATKFGKIPNPTLFD